MPLPWEPEYRKFIKVNTKKSDPETAKAKARRIFDKIDGKLKNETRDQSESPSE